MVEYDIVIIGGSLAGRNAAIAAAQLKATVALIEPVGAEVTTALIPHAFTQIAQLSHPNQLIDVIGSKSLKWEQIRQWVLGVSSNLAAQNSPSVLASLGIDVIIGEGQFHRPHLSFLVNGRSLRARAYLIATSCRPAIPDIEGLQTTNYLTIADIWQLAQLPKKWVILGGDPIGIQMAQNLTRLGFNVTMIVKTRLLPQEDREAAQLIQATLEAEGVRLLVGPVTRVVQIQDKKQIYVGERVIETDEILLAAGQISKIESLNLAAVGVKFNRRGLLLNEKQQTTNRQIYACGNGSDQSHIASYEAKTAVKNALFFPRFKVDYRNIPWAIFSAPVFARVGLTEAQARRQYPTNQLLILRQDLKTIAAAQLTDMTGICKLIVLNNGKILGATLVGPQAGELIQVIALAMSQKLKVTAIASLAPIYPTMSEILQQTAAEWNQQRLSNNTKLQEFLENFFNFLKHQL